MEPPHAPGRDVADRWNRARPSLGPRQASSVRVASSTTGGPGVLGERFERLVRGRAALVEPHHPVHADLAIAGQEVDALLTRDGRRLGPDMDGDREGRRIPIDLLAACADRRQCVTDLVRRHSIDVELIREARRQPPRDVRPVAPDHDRDPWPLDGLRDVDGVPDAAVPALERGVFMLVPGKHLGDHPEVVAEPGETLTRLREAVAVGEPLVPLPAGPDPELHPPAADRVHRRDHLGRERRVAERRADHDVAETYAARQGRQGRERRERLEGDLVGRSRHGVEVVEQPDRLESEPIGLLGDLGRPLPRGQRIPAVVFADPTLRNDRADLHRQPPVRADIIAGRRHRAST